MIKLKSLTWFVFFLLFFIQYANAQDISPDNYDQQVGERRKIKFNSIGFGLQTLGLSQFNTVFNSLNISSTPTARYAFYFTRLSLPEGTKVFTGYNLAGQSYIVAKQNPGELSYTFAKQNIDFNLGLFLIDNEWLTVPLYGGPGISVMVFNSHTNFNNQDKDFKDVLIDGSGTGIFNLSEIAVNGSLITGVDIKTARFMKTASQKSRNINIGIRTGFTYAALQLQAGIEGVNGIPQTDRFNYFVSLNVTTFIFPCKN